MKHNIHLEGMSKGDNVAVHQERQAVDTRRMQTCHGDTAAGLKGLQLVEYGTIKPPKKLGTVKDYKPPKKNRTPRVHESNK